MYETKAVKPAAMKPAALFLSSGDVLADRRYERAKAYAAEGDRTAAADLLLQALERAPAFASAWFALGELRAQGGDVAGAVEAFRGALAADPSDCHGAAMYLAWLGELDPAAAVSPAYVRMLFDQYAPEFDQALVERLNYRGPALLRAAVETANVGRNDASRFARMIDLGCGTGLAAAAFRDCCASICGVDLSPVMVDLARRKGIYDHLDVGDMSAYLDRTCKGACDLIIAADSLIYVADLAPICCAAAGALAPGGLFGFTVETHPDTGVALSEKRRFAHGADHVRAALEAAGLVPLTFEPASTRTENGVPVAGLLVIAAK
jgi:predicted TPR repeat methyltransferase